MSRNLTQIEIQDFMDRLPLGALLRRGDEVFPNKKFKEITGFGDEEVDTLEKCMQRLFVERWKEMLHLFEMDRRSGFRQNRIVCINTHNGNERWVEWMGLQNNTEDILLFRDITQLWKSRAELTGQNRQLENQLFERTEDLERTINLLLLHHTQVKEIKETNRLIARVLEVNRQLLELLILRLKDQKPDFQSILGKIAKSLHQLRQCCLGQEAGDDLQNHLREIEEILWEAGKQEDREK